MKLRFIKLSNKWFVDIPWDGDVNDLQMISGSDLFLDCLSMGNFYIELEVSTNILDNSYVLTKKQEDEFGAYYSTYNYIYKGDIWLCNVTKHIFETFPEKIYIKIK